eukprot:20324_1
MGSSGILSKLYKPAAALSIASCVTGPSQRCTKMASRSVLGRLVPAVPQEQAAQVHGKSMRLLSLSSTGAFYSPVNRGCFASVGALWRMGSAKMASPMPGTSTVRTLKLYPKRAWKRKKGIGIQGGQKLKSHSGCLKR